jgi:hypothetical protein
VVRRPQDTNGHPIPETSQEKALQRREVANRRAAVLRWIDATFVAARAGKAPAVVLALQADMFDPTAASLAGYKPYIARITKLARQYGKPVLVLNGDSHHFEDDHPFSEAQNVERITVNGSDSCPHEYLRLALDPSAPGVYSFERVPLPSSGPLCGSGSASRR